MILVEKSQFATDFSQKFNKYSSTISLLSNIECPIRLIFVKLKAYKIILKVRKFQLLSYYGFSTAGGNMAVSGFRRPPPGLIGLTDLKVWL